MELDRRSGFPCRPLTAAVDLHLAKGDRNPPGCTRLDFSEFGLHSPLSIHSPLFCLYDRRAGGVCHLLRRGKPDHRVIQLHTILVQLRTILVQRGPLLAESDVCCNAGIMVMHGNHPCLGRNQAGGELGIAGTRSDGLHSDQL
jgi:hypothetical protein